MRGCLGCPPQGRPPSHDPGTGAAAVKAAAETPTCTSYTMTTWLSSEGAHEGWKLGLTGEQQRPVEERSPTPSKLRGSHSGPLFGPSPFFLPNSWNVDVRAGGQATVLDYKVMASDDRQQDQRSQVLGNPEPGSWAADLQTYFLTEKCSSLSQCKWGFLSYAYIIDELISASHGYEQVSDTNRCRCQPQCW